MGAGRQYSTSVYGIEDEDILNEIDSESYTDPADAETGHIRMCLKYQETMNRSCESKGLVGWDRHGQAQTGGELDASNRST